MLESELCGAYTCVYSHKGGDLFCVGWSWQGNYFYVDKNNFKWGRETSGGTSGEMANSEENEIAEQSSNYSWDTLRKPESIFSPPHHEWDCIVDWDLSSWFVTNLREV